MRELFLVRHGQSEHHVSGLTGGWTDTSLTPLGLAQAQAAAERLAAVLAGARPALFTSDLQRASQTAQVIGAALGIEAAATRELRELNNGAAAGRSEAEAASIQRPPTEPALDWIQFEGGESWRMLHRRIARFLDHLDGTLQTAVVVTHENALVCAVNWWLRIDADRLLTTTMYDADPGSITRLRIGDSDCRTIAFLNDTSHLRNI